MSWIQDNLLALYAAIVGTIALFLNFGRFWLMLQKYNRKLKVNSTVINDARERLEELEKPSNGYCSTSLCGPLFTIDVINTSHVTMHIHDAGIVIKTNVGKEKIKVYIQAKHGLEHIERNGGIDMPAGSSKKFSIYLSVSNEMIPNIIGCYVIDQMGKEYSGKHDDKGFTLKQPCIYQEPNKPLNRDK